LRESGTDVLGVAITKRLGGFTLEVSWTGTERVVALLGASGSGKTLTLHCLAGLVTPDSGHIELDGTVLFNVRAGINVRTRERRRWATCSRATRSSPT
jgi:molybdate transport system ATP-binding protein